MLRPPVASAGVLLAFGLALSDASEVGTPGRLPGGPFEASGATLAPGGRGILFVDDGRPDGVLWIQVGPDGSPTGKPVVVPLGVSVEDPEGITSDGEHVYVVGSQSRGRSPRSAGLVRFRFDASGRAERVEAVSDLAAMLAGRIPSVDDRHRHEDALNIEGLAWDPGGRRLLLGLRSPLASGMALLVPLKLRDPRGPFQAANLEVEEPIRLDLGGSGIRSIEADPADGTFWIVAGGVTGAGKARLVRWGGKGPGVTDVVAFPPHLRPEGVAILGAKGVKTALVLCDTGEFVVVHAGPGEPRRGAR